MGQTETTTQNEGKVPTNPAYPFPYTVGGMSPEVTVLALRGLVEAYRFASDSVAQYTGADKVGTVDGLLAFCEGVKKEDLVCASTFRAIHAICPEVAQELREIGSIQLGTNRGKAMYRMRRGRLFARLGIDSKRDDSEFNVLDAGEPIVYPEWEDADQQGDTEHDQEQEQQESREGEAVAAPQRTVVVKPFTEHLGPITYMERDWFGVVEENGGVDGTNALLCRCKNPDTARRIKALWSACSDLSTEQLENDGVSSIVGALQSLLDFNEAASRYINWAKAVPDAVLSQRTDVLVQALEVLSQFRGESQTEQDGGQIDA